MYKPNGEELMTKQEEAMRKAAVADRHAGRTGDEATTEVPRSAFYAALFRSSASRSNAVEANLENVR